MRPSKDSLIASLGLEPHVEGGYFRRTFEAKHRARVTTPAGPRMTATSIYYLLTSDSPIGRWHSNRSDILHFFHLGDPLVYHLIWPDGRYARHVLGPDLSAGQQLQLAVEGGVWKATQLLAGSYALLGEAVAPGFEREDMKLGVRDELLARFPQHSELIEALSGPASITASTTGE